MIDVCLILEGTYPYVTGGVSTWVHQLVTSMKDIRFGIVYIAPHSDPTRRYKYAIPNHVLFFKEIYLHDYQLSGSRLKKPKRKDYDLVRSFYENLVNDNYDQLIDFIRLFQGNGKCLDAKTVFSSKEIWDLVVHFYAKYGGNASFLDYFWTWRSTHLPIIKILTTEIPKAGIYHSISTGYAGLLGAMGKAIHKEKFFLTEHGIYTHERILEITQAHWIYEDQMIDCRITGDLSFFRKWWIAIFQLLSRIAYHYADQIFTLYEGNKTREIVHGAKASKISIIPNGINTVDYTNLESITKKNPEIALIGRVVTIKDIKTFILAAKLTLEKIPDAQFYILGPTDEEVDYYQECRSLVENLNLGNCIHFKGQVDPKEYYRFLDLVVLTSISEAQPYAILEANTAGIPVVATDVGACREILEGGTLEDKALGPSGLLTEVASPEGTSQAIIRLLNEKVLYQKCAKAGKERVTRFYDQADLLSRYLNVYEQNL